MKYRILPLIIIFTLLLGGTANAEPKYKYSFKEAFEIALKNSSEYKSKDSAISKAYDNFEALEEAAPADVKFLGNMNKFISSQVEPLVKVEEAYSNYQQAILDRDNAKIDIALNLRAALIAIEKAEMAAQEADINKKTWEDELKLLNLRRGQNLIVESEYKSKKTELENKIDGLEKTQDTLNEAYYNLNTILGREDEKDIEITLDDTVISLDKLDLGQIKKDMMKKETALVQKSNQRHAKKVYFDLVEERYLKYDLEDFPDSVQEDMTEIYEEAKEDFEAADLSYEKALIDFNKSYDKMLEEIDDKMEEIEDIKEDIMEEQQNIEMYKKKYEFRIISKAQYNNSLNNITVLQNKLKAAELELNQKYAEFLVYSDMKKVLKEE